MRSYGRDQNEPRGSKYFKFRLEARFMEYLLCTAVDQTGQGAEIKI